MVFKSVNEAIVGFRQHTLRVKSLVRDLFGKTAASCETREQEGEYANTMTALTLLVGTHVTILGGKLTLQQPGAEPNAELRSEMIKIYGGIQIYETLTPVFWFKDSTTRTNGLLPTLRIVSGHVSP